MVALLFDLLSLAPRDLKDKALSFYLVLNSFPIMLHRFLPVDFPLGRNYDQIATPKHTNTHKRAHTHSNIFPLSLSICPPMTHSESIGQRSICIHPVRRLFFKFVLGQLRRLLYNVI